MKERGEIAGQHKVAIKATAALKADLDAIDRALVLCGCQDDPKRIAPCTKYEQLFGRNELKLTARGLSKDGPADDETLAAAIIEAMGWDWHAIWPDVLEQARDALQREQKAGRVPPGLLH